MPTKLNSRSIRRIIVGAAALLISFAAYGFGFFNSWQDQLNDRLFAKQPQPQNIVIVAADDASISEIGQWPWPRAVFGQAISALQNAKTTGIDISFSEPSSLGSSDDQAFAHALAASKVPVVFPTELTDTGAASVVPLPAFLNASPSESTGFINILNDSDGSSRKIESERVGLQDSVPSFSYALAIAGTGSSTLSTPPRDMRISYRGPAQTYLTVSFSDLIHGRLPTAIFKDSYVLIGATAPTLRDSVKTPFGEMPGVELHANALSTILSGRFLSDVSIPLGMILILICEIAAALFVIRCKRFSILAASIVGLLAAILIVSAISFGAGAILPMFYLIFGTILMAVAMISLEYVFESKEKRFIRESFQYYLSPEVVHDLIQNPDKLSLGGEKRKVTILFSDIRGFTSLSESLSPEGLVEIMNEYLTVMSDIIMAHGGLVDKYIGDAIMAFWGAPLDNSNQAADACRAAAAMSEALIGLNKHWESRGLPKIGIGVGINSGEAIVGNMGSARRFNYTIMGDEVNFASRLEGLNKMYRSSCIISEGALKALNGIEGKGKDLPEGTYIRELDKVTVKGKSEPKKIYDLIARPTATESEKADIAAMLEKFESARRSYEKGNWDAAIAGFKEILSKAADGPSAALLERAEEFKKNPPESWNGVYAFHSK